MRGYKPKNSSGDLLLKLTIDPDPGYAVKEIFYTYNEKTNSLYAIFPRYPDNNQLVLKSIVLPAGTAISFLSTKENVSWKQEGENTVVNLPAYNPNKIKAPYAYAIKISGYGKFAKKPAIKVDYKNEMQPTVSLLAGGTDAIHYTTDGTLPTPQSAVYDKPFLVDKTSVVQAVCVPANGLPGSVAMAKVIRYEWLKALSPAKLAPGLLYKYYEPAGKATLQSIKNTAVSKTGVTNVISTSLQQRRENFVLVFDGYIKIAKDGFYTFTTSSDDGSKLFIDDMEVADNDGDHGNTGKSGKVVVRKGYHKITVQYYNGAGESSLDVSMQPEGGAKVPLPPAMLFHENQ